MNAHQLTVHAGDTPQNSSERAKAALSALNRRDPGNWQRYSPHRERLMKAVCSGSERAAIGVFGAGNCADVDVDVLSRFFREIHLIDLDGEALERARDRLPSELRARTTIHGDVDLSGFLNRLDEWGERFPEPAELGPEAVRAAHHNLEKIGRPFDVVLSTCVLSQLLGAYHRCWVTSPDHWQNLDMATTAVYLATLAGATRAGGEGFIAFDAPSGEDADGLLQQLLSPGLSSLVASPSLTDPWLWDAGGESLLVVYGLRFRRT